MPSDFYALSLPYPRDENQITHNANSTRETTGQSAEGLRATV